MRRVLLILFFTYLSACDIDMIKEDVKKEYYRGKIKNIYQDEQNHMMTTFTIESHGAEFNDVVTIWPDIWHYAEIGDSIIKPADTLMVIVKKNDSTYKEFFYDF